RCRQRSGLLPSRFPWPGGESLRPESHGREARRFPWQRHEIAGRQSGPRSRVAPKVTQLASTYFTLFPARKSADENVAQRHCTVPAWRAWPRRNWHKNQAPPEKPAKSKEFHGLFAFPKTVSYVCGVLNFGEKDEDFRAVGREGIAGGPFSFPPTLLPISSRQPRATFELSNSAACVAARFPKKDNTSRSPQNKDRERNLYHGQ